MPDSSYLKTIMQKHVDMNMDDTNFLIQLIREDSSFLFKIIPIHIELRRETSEEILFEAIKYNVMMYCYIMRMCKKYFSTGHKQFLLKAIKYEEIIEF